MKTPVYKRLARLVLRYWPYLLVSTIAAIAFVALNTFSISLIASLVNNILTDFDSIIKEQLIWAQAEQLTLNEKLKFLTNKIILQDSQLGSLKRLCLVIFGVFLLKNIFLYIKNIMVSYVQLEKTAHKKPKYF